MVIHKLKISIELYYKKSSATAEIDDESHCHKTSFLLFFKFFEDWPTDNNANKDAPRRLKKQISFIYYYYYYSFFEKLRVVLLTEWIYTITNSAHIDIKLMNLSLVKYYL